MPLSADFMSLTRRRLRRRSGQVLTIMALLAVAGCTMQGSMRPSVNLALDQPRPNTVQGWGFPSADGDPGAAWYYSISINLRAAPAFVFTFPDGYSVNSKDINSGILARHLAGPTKGDKGETVSRVSFAKGESNASIVFFIGSDGIAENLSIHSCKYGFRQVFGKLNGERRFDFPIRQKEIVELFGGPLRIGHDFVLQGFACD